MQPTLPRSRHMRLTLRHQHSLFSNLLQPTQHLYIPILEPENAILDPRLLAKLAHQRLRLPQIMPRHAREQVMHSLELQTPVNEIQPRGAVDIHGRAQLVLGETLAGEDAGRHAPVGEGDLDMQGHSGEVRDEDEQDAVLPGGDAERVDEVAEPEEIPEDGEDFRGTGPQRAAHVGRAGFEQVRPGEEVEVEARGGHDGVVGVGLEAQGEVGDGVVDEDEAVVVGGGEGFEEFG